MNEIGLSSEKIILSGIQWPPFYDIWAQPTDTSKCSLIQELSQI